MSTRAHRGRTARHRARGLTVLELIIVMAIIGFGAVLGYSGFRLLTHAALGDDTNDLAALLRRTNVLAVEGGVPVRVVFDFEKEAYWVEACVGDSGLRRAKEEEKVDVEAQQKAIEEARQRLASMPPGGLPTSVGEEGDRMLTAIAGNQIGGRVCRPVGDKSNAELGELLSLDADGRDLKRKLNTGRGVKLREVWVQHLEGSATGGQVSITFFPLGWAEKAIIELGDDEDHVYSVLVHGVTGRIEIREGAMRNPDDHMLRNAKGERLEER